MTVSERVRYTERGASFVPLAWGPAFALIGYLAEALAGIGTHPIAWLLIGLALLASAALWIYARRRFLTVVVTADSLWQGREQLTLRRITGITGITGVGTPAGARVLGGGWSVPRKFEPVPLRLDDDTVVLAWARDPEALRAALLQATRAD